MCSFTVRDLTVGIGTSSRPSCGAAATRSWHPTSPATTTPPVSASTPICVVAQSLAGFTAPLVCARLPVDLRVMVAAMVPAPGESPGDWWANTGQPQARRSTDERAGRPTDGTFDPVVTFLHDVPEDVSAELMQRAERASRTPRSRSLGP